MGLGIRAGAVDGGRFGACLWGLWDGVCCVYAVAGLAKDCLGVAVCGAWGTGAVIVVGGSGGEVVVRGRWCAEGRGAWWVVCVGSGAALSGFAVDETPEVFNFFANGKV